MRTLKGTYLLVVEVPEYLEVPVGTLGVVSLEAGEYVYVGSAMGSGATDIEHRVSRHLRTRKTLFWHIDYLLSSTGAPRSVVVIESGSPIECMVCKMLASSTSFEYGPRGFGSSDCSSGCRAHLLRHTGKGELMVALITALEGLHIRRTNMTAHDDSWLVFRAVPT
ncbi:MAG: GIY-YIG nuclease family protein [Candidatus Thorarchaeota archaeon]|nr:GIY-YIG nuclease family protein [Candidatus Thorarchaeota archaeon]